MPLRCAPPVRATALALVAVLGMGATLTTAAVAPDPAGATISAASGGTAEPDLLLESQSPWVTPSSPVLQLGLAPGSVGSFSGLDVDLTLYARLTSRSVFEQMLTTGPSGSVLDHSGPAPLSSFPAAGPGVDLAITIDTNDSTTAPGSALDLGCEPGSCSGVYPLAVTLERADGALVGRLTTFLTYAESTSAQPLRFAWVAPVALAAGTNDVAPPSRAGVVALSQLADALASHPAVPATVAAEPRTLQSLARGGAAGARTLATLGQLSNDQTSHQFLAQPYVPVDANALAGAGLTGELNAQMTRGDAVAAAGRITVDTGGVTWLATSSLGTAFARALGPLDATRVVLPDTDLASASGRTPTLGQPFDLELGHNRSVLAAASDGELASHFAPSAAKDPALAATQLLADLALVHYEAPSPSNAPRGLVAVPPAGWVPNPTFDDTLLAGLENNPNVAPVTLATLFAEVPVGGNGWPADRVLATSGPGPVMGPGLAHSVAAARLRLTAFAGAVSGAQGIVNGLDDRLLAAQSLALRPAGQAHGVAAFERSLSDQLSLISLATERTVTLTSRTATIPVTILSAAHYTVQGTLTLASDKLVFPPPGPTRLHVVIDHPTNAVRFQVVARTSGDLPLSVTFVSPNRGLVLAHGELTVRSTATSIVGVVLTLAAAAVLLGWWARTWRARRRARRPRAA